MVAQLPLEPDTKDWTWVLSRPCPDCGFVAAEVQGGQVATLLLQAVGRFAPVAARAEVSVRPQPAVWSPLEYLCHVRDVCRLFEQRARLMLAQDDPVFDNWDQDETAVVDRYAEQDPATVGRELAAAAEQLAGTFEGVGGDQWARPGRRSNGSRFTVLTLGQYALHDVYHHLHDVGA